MQMGYSGIQRSIDTSDILPTPPAKHPVCRATYLDEQLPQGNV